MPESPALQRAREYLQVLDADDEAALAFASAHPGPRPPEHGAAWTGLWRRQTGGLDAVATGPSEGDPAELVARARTGGDHWRLRVRTAPAPPHRVVEVGLRPALPSVGRGLGPDAALAELARFLDTLEAAGQFSASSASRRKAARCSCAPPASPIRPRACRTGRTPASTPAPWRRPSRAC